MTESKFLVLIPAFNEEKNLKVIIPNLKQNFSSNKIILLDDGSTDNTSKLALDHKIKIIRNKSNQGKGHILKSAFKIIIEKYPKIKWIITFDADGQHNYKNIPKFIKTIEKRPNLGIIVGKRNYHQMPIKSRISNFLTSSWCKYWLKWNITDLQCGFRCYNMEAIKLILEYGLRKNKFELETEILLVGWILSIQMIEIPISTIYIKNHRKSRIIPIIDTLRWMLLVLQFGFSLKFTYEVWNRRHLSSEKLIERNSK